MERFIGVKRLAMAGAVALALAVGSHFAAAPFVAEPAHASWWNNDEVEFRGYIEELPKHGHRNGTWKIGGRTVIVTHETEIDLDGRALAVGLYVEVDGTEQHDGTFLASEIEYDD